MTTLTIKMYTINKVFGLIVYQFFLTYGVYNEPLIVRINRLGDNTRGRNRIASEQIVIKHSTTEQYPGYTQKTPG